MAAVPLVSFVICLYQQAAFVERAVASVLGQSLGDIELIVVDDGSTDGGDEVVRRFEDRRLKLIRQINQGPSAALNRGLEACRGTYVAFLGGDDVAVPDRAREQVELLEATQADIVFCLPTLIDEKDRRLHDSVYGAFFRFTTAQINADPLRRLFFDGNMLCAPSACGRRDMFAKLGGFALGLVQLQDYEYWVRAARSGYKLYVSDAPLVNYRIRYGGSNLSSGRFDGRTRIENDYVMRSFFNGCLPEALRVSFYQERPNNLPPGVREDDLHVALTYFKHPDPTVRRIGYDRMINFLGHNSSAAALAEEVGLSLRAFFEIWADA